MKQISDNEIYLLIKYIKSVLWRTAKCMSHIEDARCVEVNSSDLVQRFTATLTTTEKLRNDISVITIC